MKLYTFYDENERIKIEVRAETLDEAKAKANAGKSEDDRDYVKFFDDFDCEEIEEEWHEKYKP